MINKTLLFPTLIACLISCDDTTKSTGGCIDLETKSVSLLSYKSPCTGVSQQLCMQTKDNMNFYGPIENFAFTWGHNYELLLNVSEIANPPADGSNLKYELKETISDSEDEIGTNYEYKLVEVLDATFTKKDDIFYFLSQPFECSTDVDCDSLIDLSGSSSLVDLSFEYIGNGKISLTQWKQ